MAGFPPEYLIGVRYLLLCFYTCFIKSLPCPLLCSQFHYTWILQRRLTVLFLCSCSLDKGILKMGGIEAALLSAHSFSACHQLILNQTILFKGKPIFFFLCKYNTECSSTLNSMWDNYWWEISIYWVLFHLSSFSSAKGLFFLYLLCTS